MTEIRAGQFFDGDRMAGPSLIRLREGLIDDIHPIDGIGLSAAERNRTLVPGFVDLQINGFEEVSFATCTTDEFAGALTALPRTGVTTIVPTFPSRPGTEQLESAGRLNRVPWVAGRARTSGFQLEGPFISPERKGAHPLDALKLPSRGAIDEVVAAHAAGLPIRLVTLAPELDGGLDAIERLTGAGIRVAIGHSAADFDTAIRGFAAGASVVTHLFNAQDPLAARAPGVVGAALTSPRAVVGLIADFVHVHPAVCAIVFAAAGSRIALVTDQSAHASTVDATPRLSDGTLAGSALNLDQALRNIRAQIGRAHV